MLIPSWALKTNITIKNKTGQSLSGEYTFANAEKFKGYIEPHQKNSSKDNRTLHTYRIYINGKVDVVPNSLVYVEGFIIDFIVKEVKHFNQPATKKWYTILLLL